MVTLKDKYRIEVYQNNKHIYEIAKHTNRSLQTVIDWFRRGNQKRLTDINLLNLMSNLLGVEVEELTHKSPTLVLPALNQTNSIQESVTQ